jgi:hypothetical protein
VGAVTTRSFDGTSTYRRFQRQWRRLGRRPWAGLEVAVLLDGARGKSSGGGNARAWRSRRRHRAVRVPGRALGQPFHIPFIPNHPNVNKHNCNTINTKSVSC